MISFSNELAIISRFYAPKNHLASYLSLLFLCVTHWRKLIAILAILLCANCISFLHSVIAGYLGYFLDVNVVRVRTIISIFISSRTDNTFCPKNLATFILFQILHHVRLRLHGTVFWMKQRSSLGLCCRLFVKIFPLLGIFLQLDRKVWISRGILSFQFLLTSQKTKICHCCLQ